ncbi:MAG: hypothetical protein HYV94_09100 [Candidatus Rokubacteria bacterium]|nr:hypothetical protein [Candidatus Rokubacteria bacterium]
MSARLPYLATSLVLLAVGFGYALTQGRADRPAPPRPAGVAVAPRVPPPRPLPTARELLDRRAALSLSEEQTRRLEVLAREWSSESARLEAELQAATAEFSADAGELGAWVREQRRLHGEAAAGLLADWQRAKLVQEASGVPVGGGR